VHRPKLLRISFKIVLTEMLSGYPENSGPALHLPLPAAPGCMRESIDVALHSSCDKNKIVNVAVAFNLSEPAHSAAHTNMISSFDKNKIVDAFDKNNSPTNTSWRLHRRWFRMELT